MTCPAPTLASSAEIRTLDVETGFASICLYFHELGCEVEAGHEGVAISKTRPEEKTTRLLEMNMS